MCIGINDRLAVRRGLPVPGDAETGGQRSRGGRRHGDLAGGASDVELIRPTGVPVRVRVGSGVSDLAIDDFRVGSAGGKTDWRSPDYDQVEGRYDVEIGAGASEVTIRT